MAVFQSTPGITGLQAVELALRFAKGTRWQLGFLSNTGITCSVLSEELQHLEEALMHADGTAGQWVVEFFEKPPNVLGRSWVHIRSVIITARGATTLPDTSFEPEGPMSPLQLPWVKALETSRLRVLQRVHRAFDLMSVASEIGGDGSCDWNFTMYRCVRRGSSSSRQVVGKAIVSAEDGDLTVW